MESLGNESPAKVVIVTPSSSSTLPSTVSKPKSPVSDCSFFVTTPTNDDSVDEPNQDFAASDKWLHKNKSSRFLQDEYPGPPAKKHKKGDTSSESSNYSDASAADDTSSESEDEHIKPKKVVKVTAATVRRHGRTGYKKFMLSDSDEDESKMSAAQLQRKRNIEAQQEFLRKLDMEETKRELEACCNKPKKASKPHEVKPKIPITPRAKSVRIQRAQVRATRAKGQDVTPTLQMDEILHGKFNCQDVTDYFARLHSELYATTAQKTADMDLKTCSLEEFEAKISNLTLRNEYQSLKDLPDLISTFAVHPSRNAIILAAGGESGSVGFWNLDVEVENWDDSNVMVFLPHVNNVSAITFSEYDVNAVFSCSFDGTVRHGDLSKQAFELLYTDDIIIPLHCIVEQGQSKLYASQQGGNIVGIDTRIHHNKQIIYRTRHSGNIHTLSMNPSNQDQLLSCSEDKLLVLWDLRLMSTRRCNSPIWQLYTRAQVSSAFFSGSGSRILTTHGADLACIYETQGNGEPFKSWEVQRPGRSPNAVAKAVWHPQREDTFCVPNNKDGLDVYSCEYTDEHMYSLRQPLHLPMKHCTQAAFHLTLPVVVASCNRSLQLFL